MRAANPYSSPLELFADACELARTRLRLRIVRRRLEERTVLGEAGGGDLEGSLATLDREHTERQIAVQARRDATHPEVLGIASLARAFGLDAFECELVVLSVCAVLDPLIPQLLAKLHQDGSRDYLDPDGAIAFLTDSIEDQIDARRRFDDGAPLFAHRVLVLQDARYARKRMRFELRPSPGTLRALLREAAVENPLAGFCEIVEPSERLDRVVLPEPWKSEVVNLVTHHRTTDVAGSGLTLLFSGPPGTGKTLFARALAREVGRPLLLVNVGALLSDHTQVLGRIDAVFFEATLRGAIVFLDECEALFVREMAQFYESLHALEAFAGVIFLATNRPVELDPAIERRITYIARFTVPSAPLRERIWRLHLPEDVAIAPDVEPAELAERFDLAGGHIKNAVGLALNHARAEAVGGRPVVQRAHLLAGATRQVRGRDVELTGEPGARPALSLDDLVLPSETRESIVEILDACRNQDRLLRDWGFGARLVTGRGLVCLFDGEPGTGKTYCAEVIAAELGRPLHRVHIPGIVSKYVGDTEKNLSKVFEVARAQRAILLFDEADSLFASRVKVESSNDRFANMETNQLLQEIERFDGITILTTNLERNMDSAFARRIQFRVKFPFPGADERARIWRVLLPASAQVSRDVDFQALAASYDIQGGYIKNAVVRAAYLALAEGGPIRQDHLEKTARKECEAAGKLVRESSGRPR